jgi:hypothetical protein
MTTIQKAIIGLLSVIVCIIVAGVVVYVFSTFFLGGSSSQLQSGVQPALASTSNAPEGQNGQIWVIYEVAYTGVSHSSFVIQQGGSATITWVNNTGGTNQIDRFIGDGMSYEYDISGEPTPRIVTTPPFREAYTARSGEVFSIIAQKADDFILGGLACHIYLSDSIGAHCFVENGQSCENINKWKESYCTGQSCVCQTSGVVSP